jgi:hypothetical protein
MAAGSAALAIAAIGRYIFAVVGRGDQRASEPAANTPQRGKESSAHRPRSWHGI